MKHVKWAARIALDFQNTLKTHVEADDLVSEAMFALTTAGKRFEKLKGVSFTTFVRHRIRGALIDYMTPRKNRPFEELYLPDDVQDDEEILTGAFHLALVDRGAERRSLLADGSGVLVSGLKALRRRHRDVLMMYFLDGMTCLEIAQILQVNESRISQLKNAALDKLRATLELRGVRKLADIL